MNPEFHLTAFDQPVGSNSDDDASSTPETSTDDADQGLAAAEAAGKLWPTDALPFFQLVDVESRASDDDAAATAAPRRRSRQRPPKAVARPRTLDFATSSFACAILRRPEEEPQRSLAGAAFCALLADGSHLGPDARAEDGAVVPPPMVGCVMWLLRHDPLTEGPWPAPSSVLARDEDVVGPSVNHRASAALQPLEKAILAAGLPFDCPTPPPVPVGERAPNRVEGTVGPQNVSVVAHRGSFWHEDGGDDDGQLAPIVAGKTLVDQYDVTFGDSIRLVLQRQGPRRWVARVDARRVDGPPDGLGWCRLAEVSGLAPPRALRVARCEFAEATHPSLDSQRPDSGRVIGSRLDALRALDDLAAALGFRPHASPRQSLRWRQRIQHGAGDRPTNSAAAELLRSLDTRGISPFPLDALQRLGRHTSD